MNILTTLFGPKYGYTIATWLLNCKCNQNIKFVLKPIIWIFLEVFSTKNASDSNLTCERFVQVRLACRKTRTKNFLHSSPARKPEHAIHFLNKRNSKCSSQTFCFKQYREDKTLFYRVIPLPYPIPYLNPKW